MGVTTLLLYTAQELLKLTLKFNRRRGRDIPFEMDNYVKSVVVQGRLYVGGGWAGWGIQ